MSESHAHIYKTLTREIELDLSRRRDVLCLWIQRLNVLSNYQILSRWIQCHPNQSVSTWARASVCCGPLWPLLRSWHPGHPNTGEVHLECKWNQVAASCEMLRSFGDQVQSQSSGNTGPVFHDLALTSFGFHLLTVPKGGPRLAEPSLLGQIDLENSFCHWVESFVPITPTLD